MNLPRKPEDLAPYLLALGVAVATGKLLAVRETLTLSVVVSRAIEGGLMAMCAGVGLFLVLGLGGLLASLGRSGIIKIASAITFRKSE
jgi:hypothetical protein